MRLVPALAKKSVVGSKVLSETGSQGAPKRQKIKRGQEKMLNFSWIKRHKGQGMVEYILIAAVIAGIIFVAYKSLDKKVKEKFESTTRIAQKADK
jgi:Flp pilus assembly pilin Flp